jgi:3-methyladenine DNA glycosylase AlkD
VSSAWADDAVARVCAAFEDHRDPSVAQPMARYLRDQFPFFGLPTPQRVALQRSAWAGLDRPALADVVAAVDALWALPEREHQYAACDLLDRQARLLEPASLPWLQELLTTRAWWDSVDSLRKPLGTLVLTAPELKATLKAWNRADDRWLVRSSIIFQLGYKQQTDQAFLFEMCANRATDSEFFVRKGIGWALREHSKTDGEAVRAFVDGHPELSPLSQREALKWLERRERRAQA